MLPHIQLEFNISLLFNIYHTDINVTPAKCIIPLMDSEWNQCGLLNLECIRDLFLQCTSERKKGSRITKEPQGFRPEWRHDIRMKSEMATVILKTVLWANSDPSLWVSLHLQTCSINKPYSECSPQHRLPRNELFSQSAMSCNLFLWEIFPFLLSQLLLWWLH